MTKSCKYLRRAVILAASGTIATATSVLAQSITIDGTLSPAQTLTGPVYTIPQSAGQTVGSNLFQSFGKFNLNMGEIANFESAGNIRNILSRVTGGGASMIDGLISTNSANVNLFLINPSGIVFGPNASLNVGGSFVASTANALQFGNLGFFSATDKNIPSPLLTINPSALLFNQINQNAAIQNNSVAPAGIDPAGLNAFGLRVPDGKSLLLVGGNVSMDGGQLNAYGGRVELGGLTQAGTVFLGVDGDNLSLIFPDNVGRSEVSLTNQAGIDVEGAGGGNIAVNARNLEILEGSFLSAGIGQGLGTPETVAGDITLNATGEIKVAGTQRGVRNLVRLGSKGNGGNITIDSGSLLLQDGAQLVDSTFGQGNAGNVTVRATDAVDLANGDILSTVEAGGVGKGGNIDINAATLSLIDSAELQTLTRRASATGPAGRGDAGNVNVNVTGAVDIAGNKNGFPSGISSAVETETQGNGGNITINSGSFSLRDLAQVQTSTLGQGNAGNVTVRALDAVSLANASILSTVESGGVGKGGNIDINAATLSLIDGAQLLTITRRASNTGPAGRGDAGNVNIKVTESVDIAGRNSGILSFVETGTQGNGGNITIDSGSFSLQNGAQLAASTFGQGNAGTIKVNAADFFTISSSSSNINTGLFVNSQSPTGTAGDIIVTSPRVTLDNRGKLNAQSASGNGGNITLQVPDLLLLRRGSQISATAGNGKFSGNGGNINIDAGFIVAVPQENSDITANAFSGNGGTVTINAQGIFGIQSRQQPTSQSDITASSKGGGINGVVDINTLYVDPNRGFINLPTNVVNTPSLVAESCSAFGKKGSEFIVTGRGGLPPSPDDFLSSDVVWSDTRLSVLPVSRSPGVTRSVRKTAEGVAIVPATGWVFDEKKGEVTLIAANASSEGVGSNQVKCIVP
ncbi:hemagglutination activity domain protein [Tolypothrix sp. NIES-4075]|uniref:two-partner secretion domain-containing protein n=1 Tax=Tolypothrix sp. NIES-4075 TaxID=2005459 RepID=UPI000B5CD697|nr:S-layer family protein [Tolypothrix sp. NIES-4075]GAX42820.1 hemagglutination activity domain protein [Tolypothrix sp. NIES-4075]